MKKCTSCLVWGEKDIDFGKDITSPDGYKYNCKKCRREANKLYKKTHREIILAQKRRHWLRVKEQRFLGVD